MVVVVVVEDVVMMVVMVGGLLGVLAGVAVVLMVAGSRSFPGTGYKCWA